MKTFAALILLILPALAEPPADSDRPERDRRPREEGHERGDRSENRTRDGIHDRAEKAVAERFFEKWDADQDGKISPEEFARVDRLANLPEETRSKIFARFDRNGDGLLEKKEMARPKDGPPPPPRHFLRSLDTDKDGRISFEEFSARDRMKRADPERIRAFFNRLDRNSDGFLDRKDRPKDREERKE